ncbi:MAG: cytochrome c nitrite reductase small subunit [bacterium]
MTSPPLATIAIGVAVGLAAGLGGYTFIYAKGAAYLKNDPNACANCHVMNEQLTGWTKSSHRAVATCNDCHTPHNIIGKYLTKAENGFRHSLAFTTGQFHEPIRITAHDREITEEACRHCHNDMVVAIDGPHKGAEPTSCIRCHRSVGHLE